MTVLVKLLCIKGKVLWILTKAIDRDGGLIGGHLSLIGLFVCICLFACLFIYLFSFDNRISLCNTISQKP